MKWLEAQLLDCKGPFIILSCGTMWSDYVTNGKDSWGVFDPAGREQIFELIEKHRIGGRAAHLGRPARRPRVPHSALPSGFNFYEFEPASLGGRGDGPPATNPEGGHRSCSAWSASTPSASSRFDATLPDPEVVFRLVHDAGDVLYELKLARSQLTPPLQH